MTINEMCEDYLKESASDDLEKKKELIEFIKSHQLLRDHLDEPVMEYGLEILIATVELAKKWLS